MDHWLDKEFKGEGGAQGAEDDSDPGSSPNLDSDPYLEDVIFIELLSLSPYSSNWGGQTIMA